jgi:hypothetical protein
MDPKSSESLQLRFDRWEREKRQLISVLIVVCLVSVGVFTQSARQWKRAGVVEAEQFLVRDKAGTVRAKLALNPDGAPQLTMLDERGRYQVIVRGNSDSTSTLYLFEGGKSRVIMSADWNGHSALNFVDRENRGNTGLYMCSDGVMGLTMRHGNQATEMSVKPNGKSGVRVQDTDGREVARLGDPTPVSLLADDSECYDTRPELDANRRARLETTATSPPQTAQADTNHRGS